MNLKYKLLWCCYVMHSVCAMEADVSRKKSSSPLSFLSTMMSNGWGTKKKSEEIGIMLSESDKNRIQADIEKLQPRIQYAQRNGFVSQDLEMLAQLYAQTSYDSYLHNQINNLLKKMSQEQQNIIKQRAVLYQGLYKHTQLVNYHVARGTISKSDGEIMINCYQENMNK